MKVQEFISKLLDYNMDAEFNIIVDNKIQPFEIAIGESEGCTRKNCESVLLYPTEHNEVENADVYYNYKSSGMVDIKGNKIYEGSIINADGYNSMIEDNSFHCVEFENGIFGSDIYSDFEPISNYDEIEVIGHVEDFRKEYETGLCTGNIGAVIK